MILTRSQKHDLPALGTLLISGLGILGMLTSAVVLAFTGLAVLAGGAGFIAGQAMPFFSLAWAAVFLTVLLTPALVNAFTRLLQRDQPSIQFSPHLRLASLLLLFFPLLVAAGDFLSFQSRLSWALLPPLQVLAAAIPILWIFEIGRSGLQLTVSRRGWNLINFNLLISQPLILAAEATLILSVSALAVLSLSGRMDLADGLQRLAERIQDSGMDPDFLQRMAIPLLQKPAVILGILLVVAGLIPLLEEFLKPLALWGLAKHSFDPVDGFIAGLLCGACFALVETLGSFSNLTDQWALLVIGRMGTGLLHITTTGLTGWGLASALSEGRYRRLGVTYLISAGLHSLWNVFSLLLGIDPLLDGAPSSWFINLLHRLGGIAPAVLLVLAAVLAALLTGCNRRLRKMPRHTQILPGAPPAPVICVEESG